MIDIHAHVLPGVDDGARTMKEALQLIRDAYEGGTREMIVTPHCAPAYGFFNFDNEELDEPFQRLCRAVEEEIPVRLYPGMEILYEDEQSFLYHWQDYYPLCGSRYYLIEHYFDVEPEIFLESVDVLSAKGGIPVIAHPERYHFSWESMDMLLEGRKRGALFQINKGSLSGKHGKNAGRIAEKLLDLDAVDFIASDAHDPRYRGSSMKRVFQFIKSAYGEKRAYRILWKNPGRVLSNIPWTEKNEE